MSKMKRLYLIIGLLMCFLVMLVVRIDRNHTSSTPIQLNLNNSITATFRATVKNGTHVIIPTIKILKTN
jgi:hypothetical protein